jgi:hypothetical protein
MCVLWQIVTILGIVVGSTKKSFVVTVRSQNLVAWERGFKSYWHVYGLQTWVHLCILEERFLCCGSVG